MPETDNLFVCLTTVTTQAEAESLAEDIVKSRLAACVQIEAPVISLYRWRGKVEKNSEIRISIYALENSLGKLASFVEDRHPYDTPKWICMRAEKVSEKYLKWANDICNLRGFI